MLIIVMGVSGCGKTTVGQLLAKRLALPFFDADEYHPTENIEKMRSGIPLSDTDREPWLADLSLILQEQEKKEGCVLACSALKERYRVLLQKELSDKIIWIHLEGSREVLQERLEKRPDHYMSASLLSSQLEALEKPLYALHVPITLHPEQIVEEIADKIKPSMEELNQFGIIGLGVMGRNLAMNLLEKNVRLSVYNRHVSGSEEDIARLFAKEHPEAAAYDQLAEFAASLERPRKILLMIKAGEAVDQIIGQLLPHLEQGDLIMDGGNSHYSDTKKRQDSLARQNIEYLGVGISGGEEGARTGPSVMPGGSAEGYKLATPFLEKLAARDKAGHPCCIYVGPEGAGHFVKMVHNGIEYAEMQLIAEVWYILKSSPGMTPEKTALLFEEWQKEGLDSFLLEITQDILRKKEDGMFLLDKVLDKAEQKGTGGWSVKAAMDLGTPLNTITEAVTTRMISAMKSQRTSADGLYKINSQITDLKDLNIGQLKNSYYVARVINHAIGFRMMKEASLQYGWKLDLSEIARIWTNGCIIRSELIEKLAGYLRQEEELLMHPRIAGQLKQSWPDLAGIVSLGLNNGMALPVLSSSLNYFLGYVTAESPAALIQAQRDYFGAHTYRRKDRKEEEYFHSNWKP